MTDATPKPRKRRKLLLIVGGILVALFLCVIIAALSNGDKEPQQASDKPGAVAVAKKATRTPKPSKTPVPSRTPKPTNTLAPTATATQTPTFDEALEATIDNKQPAGTENIQHQYKPMPDGEFGAILDIVYEMDTPLSLDSALRLCTRSFLDTAPLLYELDPDLDVINLDYRLPSTDAYGKESLSSAVRIQINRETADKIVWENMLRCNLPKVLPIFRLHPSLTSAWQELCQ